MRRKSEGYISLIWGPDKGAAVRRGASGNDLSGFSGNSAAVRAGRRLADPVEVERAVLRASLEFLTSEKAPADSARMRAVVMPFLCAAGGAP